VWWHCVDSYERLLMFVGCRSLMKSLRARRTPSSVSGSASRVKS
jgi:hypothetical protein